MVYFNTSNWRWKLFLKHFCCSSFLYNFWTNIKDRKQMPSKQWIKALQASAVYWVKYELVTVACKSTTCNNQWNLQYFEMLSLSESSMFNILQTSVGQGESGQIWNICKYSAVQSWYLNKHQKLLTFLIRQEVYNWIEFRICKLEQFSFLYEL